MAKTKQTKLTGNTKDAVDCLRGLRRKTKTEAAKKKIDKSIKRVKKSSKS